MTKVLLTGGSGFIAAHVLETLLQRGHSVVTTVRSQAKADKIHEAHPHIAKDRLETVIVPDIAVEGAFDEVVKTPGLEAVLHTASPFHFNTTNPKKDLIDPAVLGTTGILKAISRSAPSVKRVVITSSFAAILDRTKTNDPGTTYTEASWNPVAIDEVENDAVNAYRASKTLAEKAAWDYLSSASPNFDLVTVNPPMVFGPVVHYLATLDAINTSNQRFVALVQGAWKKQEQEGKGIPDSGFGLWIDVRDVALAHVLAMEKPELSGKRLFTAAGWIVNRETLDIVRKNFPELKDQLPSEEAEGGAAPPEDKRFKFDNSATAKALGFEWTKAEKTTVDTVKSLIPFLN
ncbi:NAD dependent epimerase/dehydratase [Coniella lustricola]|uniref:NAD dependent epimerase/dehydratase n=1 Tax=Coniella lustricola TaxID=2025994 RepID=A0A2T2ZU83_9PEZI|nr:NAD dependent epimerase/dehydratase [Coniella lustricola]